MFVTGAVAQSPSRHFLSGSRDAFEPGEQGRGSMGKRIVWIALCAFVGLALLFAGLS